MITRLEAFPLGTVVEVTEKHSSTGIMYEKRVSPFRPTETYWSPVLGGTVLREEALREKIYQVVQVPKEYDLADFNPIVRLEREILKLDFSGLEDLFGKISRLGDFS